MPALAFLRPPRHLIALFLLITLVPSILLIAFGRRLLQQDRELSRQQSQERREQAADLVVAALEQSVTGAEQSLQDPTALQARSQTDDVVAVILTPGGVEAFPKGRLLYYPRARFGAAVWVEGDAVRPLAELSTGARAGASTQAATAFR